MTSILLTGFGPHEETPINPAGRVARLLGGRAIFDLRRTVRQDE
jgi:pyrrolidone-carboxylate peptidase